jgi:anti-anti-sigma factor
VLDLEATIEAAELPSGQLLVSAHGPLDERVAGTFRDALVPLAAADDTAILLDLGDAHGLDDVTFGIVAHAAHLARRRGESLRIVTQSPSLIRLVEETGLGDIVRMCGSLKEAIDYH